MSGNRSKTYSRKGTGTVPKLKCCNGTTLSNQEEQNHSSNLGRQCNHPNHVRQIKTSGKYQAALHFFGMEHSPDEQHMTFNQNASSFSSNGLLPQNIPISTSRRNSSETIPKCENITKYPDKKQIEDKLNQIQEYLQITSTLMSTMKNSENYVLENDGDSTPESLSILPKSVLEKKVEYTNGELEMLREQENFLMTLQVKAEKQLLEARQAQQKLVSHQNSNILHVDDNSDQNSNEINATCSIGIKKANQETEELEDRMNSLKIDTTPRQSAYDVQEKFQAPVESIQQKINQLRDSNDNRNQLIQLLDKRDVQLQSEHSELKSKLQELQNKKMQVDNLVYQLQSMSEEPEEDDIGFQVRKIVCMKEQLSKLKDMLEIVKNSEHTLGLQNVNDSDAEHAELVTLSTKSDNMIQNDVRNSQITTHENTANSPLEHNPRSSNVKKIKEKQINKKLMNANEKEKLKLQGELQAKKRELEELMCKHKAASSNLNQDIQCENKSDNGATNHSLYEGTTNSWYAMPSNLYHLPSSSERYSSDEGVDDDINEYSELNSSGETSNIQMVQPMASLNYSTSNYINHKSTEPGLEVPETYIRTSSLTPEQTSIANTPRFQSVGIISNSRRNILNKSQVQKQLELIRSVCDSMLEQQNILKEKSTTQSVQNNLTPSPLYSETRQFASPNPHSMNAVNVMQSDYIYAPQPTNNMNASFTESSGYQNWLAANTLQTQAFMLNTLNHCCQMLWLQQRELASLRTTTNMMQEKLQTSFDQNNSIPVYMNTNSYMYPISTPSHEHRESSQLRGFINTKTDQVSSATSLPNLNHPHTTYTANSLETAYLNHNNLQNAPVLESSLNNSIHQNAVTAHANNSMLQGVHQSLSSHIWNGQALNNQVAPGNRANNYWDNFRSYSRQNLLSTKNHEGLQNQIAAPINNSSERLHSYTFPSLPAQKQNLANQEPSNAFLESTPIRKAIFKSPTHLSNTENISTIPPDVLNTNDIQSLQKTNESTDLLEIPLQTGFDLFTNTFEREDQATSINNNCNRSGSHDCKNCMSDAQRNLNEWHNNTNSESAQSKSKLFDELRENVYREVASLISANQGRPHFLIQLFRDLQMISSDPMRRKTLHFIQSLISHSFSGSAQSNLRQATNSLAVGASNDTLPQFPSYFEIPTRHWNDHRLNHESENSLDTDCPNYLSEVLIFLNSHNEDTLQQNLLESLKELLMECTFSTAFINKNKDSIIQKHFANLATEAFEQYKGKRIQDVRMNILQTIEDLLKGEISLIRLMRENICDANDLNSLTNETSASHTNPNIHFDIPSQLSTSTCTTDNCDNQPQTQNGDLAEADQSTLELEEEDEEEEEEEEGAVGGVLNIIDECNITPNSAGQGDVKFAEQCLDQVPTRLASHSRSHINASSRDRSSPSKPDASEPF